MDIKSLTKEDAEGKNNSSGGSGGSSKKESYPKTEMRVPFAAIAENADGEKEFYSHPQHLAIEYRKKTKSASWEPHIVPANVSRYWMGHMGFKRACYRVEKHLDLDPVELLHEDAEKGERAIIKAAKMRSPSEGKSMHEKCPVCRKELHVIMGDFKRMKGRRVCKDHTVTELLDSGFLD